MSEEERQRLEKQKQESLKQVTQEYRAKGRKIFVNADKVRKAILARLPDWQKNFDHDKKNEVNLHKLAMKGADDAYDNDLGESAAYLEEIANRLTHPELP